MKYYVTLMDGKGFEVDDLTFNKLTARIKTGRTNGFYTVETGDTKGTSFNFRHIASIYIDRNEKELAEFKKDNKPRKEVFVPTESKAECDVDHKNYVTNKPAEIEPRFVLTDRGTTQYFPVCTKCGWRGTLIKPASIETIFGINIKDVVPFEDGK